MNVMRSIDPARGDIVWEGAATSAKDCQVIVARARTALRQWADLGLEHRTAVARRFGDLLAANRAELATLISRETGKALWETESEVGAMVGKIGISIAAQAERTPMREEPAAFGRAVLRHRPHGVMAVLGPYNFPGHLPNGHIVPALLAGNAVVFKPSELTPAIGARMVELWHEAGLPAGVLQLVQGGRETGAALLDQDIDGLLFTGSARAGASFRHAFAARPHVILALELGGNNPLIAWDGDAEAIASIVVQSAFITTGQRCSCARRLIVPEGKRGDAIVEASAALAQRLRIGAWNDAETPFMGPLISIEAADGAFAGAAALAARGGKVVMHARRSERSPAFMSPAIIDMTGVAAPDEEIFAPVVTVTRAPDFERAMASANATRFGLSAGLITEDDSLWQRFLRESRAGVVNRNRPTTGASSSMPFGGLGDSGNHRPSAYYAADYCAYPVASSEADRVVDQLPGMVGLAPPRPAGNAAT